MNVYTVLLLYPDYLASNYGEDTYLTHAEAANPREAIHAARRAVASECEGGVADDFACLLCIEGKHADLTPWRN